jgi:hypothetical protein
VYSDLEMCATIAIGGLAKAEREEEEEAAGLQVSMAVTDGG